MMLSEQTIKVKPLVFIRRLAWGDSRAETGYGAYEIWKDQYTTDKKSVFRLKVHNAVRLTNHETYAAAAQAANDHHTALVLGEIDADE